jgi:hypothetical protein
VEAELSFEEVCEALLDLDSEAGADSVRPAALGAPGGTGAEDADVEEDRDPLSDTVTSGPIFSIVFFETPARDRSSTDE